MGQLAVARRFARRRALFDSVDPDNPRVAGIARRGLRANGTGRTAVARERVKKGKKGQGCFSMAMIEAKECRGRRL